MTKIEQVDKRVFIPDSARQFNDLVAYGRPNKSLPKRPIIDLDDPEALARFFQTTPEEVPDIGLSNGGLQDYLREQAESEEGRKTEEFQAALNLYIGPFLTGRPDEQEKSRLQLSKLMTLELTLDRFVDYLGPEAIALISEKANMAFLNESLLNPEIDPNHKADWQVKLASMIGVFECSDQS